MTTLSRNALVALAMGAGLLGPAEARNTEVNLPFEEVLNMSEMRDKLDGSVKFYLVGQKTPKVLKRYSTDTVSRKTNGVGKDDDVACRWAALSVLIAMQNKAKSIGANAVVDMASNYKRQESRSNTDYECHAGAIVVDVTLKGTYAKIKD